MKFVDKQGLQVFLTAFKNYVDHGDNIKFALSSYDNTTNNTRTVEIENGNGYSASFSISFAGASSTTAGLMTSADKSKLDGIAAGANKYTLPVAASAALGGIQIGYTDSELNRAVKLDSNHRAYITLQNATSSVSGLMPKADKAKLDKLTIDASGIIDAKNLPSYVDDVIEGYYDSEGNKFRSQPNGVTVNGVAYPAWGPNTALITGETGKIYVDLDTNYVYRYVGTSGYVLISDTGAAASKAANDAHNVADAAMVKATTNAGNITTLQNQVSTINSTNTTQSNDINSIKSNLLKQNIVVSEYKAASGNTAESPAKVNFTYVTNNNGLTTKTVTIEALSSSEINAMF